MYVGLSHTPVKCTCASKRGLVVLVREYPCRAFQYLNSHPILIKCGLLEENSCTGREAIVNSNSITKTVSM